MKHRFILLFTALIAFSILAGCGNTNPPTMPGEATNKTQSLKSGHNLLGLYQFMIDEENETLNFVPLRACELHLNIVTFMEPPAGENFGIDQVFDFEPGKITVDLFIKHPFPDLDLVTVFDVSGIIISHGSMDFPYSETLKFPGGDDVQLLNPDGYIRWWNPVEFPENPTMPAFGYVDGMMGVPDSAGQFDATMNGYKYFATGLTDPAADLSAIDTSMRGALVPGTTSVRRYELGYTPGNFVFNYAIDANWDMPDTSDEVIDIPGDFPISANRPEPYRLEIKNVYNDLSYSITAGMAEGILGMDVWVYAWHDAEESMACAYSQGDELSGMCNPEPIEVGDGYAVYPLLLFPANLQSTDDFMIWVGAEAMVYGYQDFVPGEIQGFYVQDWVSVAEQ